MNQTEITVQLYDSMEEIERKLSAKNFKLSKRVLMTDYYFSKYDSQALREMSYAEIIKNSLIVRKLGEKNFMIYKSKEFDEKDNVISEQKYSVDIADAEIAVNELLHSGLNNWCTMAQDMHIYGNGDMGFAIQCVDGLGTYVEYEEDENIAHLDPKEKIKIMLEKLSAIGFEMGSDFSVKKVYEKFLKDSAREVDGEEECTN